MTTYGPQLFSIHLGLANFGGVGRSADAESSAVTDTHLLRTPTAGSAEGVSRQRGIVVSGPTVSPGS
jgi:hypothetical protein